MRPSRTGPRTTEVLRWRGATTSGSTGWPHRGWSVTPQTASSCSAAGASRRPDRSTYRSGLFDLGQQVDCLVAGVRVDGRVADDVEQGDRGLRRIDLREPLRCLKPDGRLYGGVTGDAAQ